MVENLEIYQSSLTLISKIYNLIRKNKNLAADWSLCDQIKRAAVSVATNISEGYLRSLKSAKNYLAIASGSANEVKTLLVIIADVYKIDTSSLIKEYFVLAKRISAFSSKLKK